MVADQPPTSSPAPPLSFRDLATLPEAVTMSTAAATAIALARLGCAVIIWCRLGRRCRATS